MKEKSIFAQNIQMLRKEKGWTQKQMSRNTGIPLPTIIGYENSLREPCSSGLFLLEQIFGVTREQLYGLEPLPHPEAREPQIQLHETPLPHRLAPASYLIGMDGGSEDGDLPGICIACSECGQVVFSGTLAPGAEATVEIPQSCPRCSVTGGRGDE